MAQSRFFSAESSGWKVCRKIVDDRIHPVGAYFHYPKEWSITPSLGAFWYSWDGVAFSGAKTLFHVPDGNGGRCAFSPAHSGCHKSSLGGIRALDACNLTMDMPCFSIARYLPVSRPVDSIRSNPQLPHPVGGDLGGRGTAWLSPCAFHPEQRDCGCSRTRRILR